MLGGILAMAMVINMFVAATAGTLIPLALRAMKVDPALASSVFITTLTDVFGFLSFLGLATLFLKYLHQLRGRMRAAGFQRSADRSSSRMPVYTSEALILRTYKLGEADRIVVFLTRDRGKKRGVAKGARRVRSRFIGALEPMTRAGVAYYEREQRDLVRHQLRRAARGRRCPAVERRCARACRLLRRADRRVGAGSAGRRAAVPTGVGGGRRDRGRRAGERAGAVLRVLDAAAAGRLSLVRLCRAPGCRRPAAGADGAGAMAAAGRRCSCAGRARRRADWRWSSTALQFLTAAGATAPDRLADCGSTARAARELEAVHRRLLALHLDKDLKSARVLREMRQAL